MNNDTDEDMIVRAVAGDSRAFRDLLEAHYLTIYKMAYRQCQNKSDAEDITQLACIKLAQNISSFNRQSAFTTWLYTIVLNTARDWHRSEGRHDKASVELDVVENKLTQTRNPENEMVTKQGMEAVRALPEPERQIVWLVFGEGLSHKQVAEIVGCAESTISWRIHEARKILKEGGRS